LVAIGLLLPAFCPVLVAVGPSLPAFCPILVAVGPYYYLVKHLSVSGKENIPKDTQVVIVSNHFSYWDPPILCIATRKPVCYIAKKELFAHPHFAALIKLLGAVAIDRKKPSLSSIKKIKEAIQAGWSLGIFIEGTRSKIEGSMGQPHTGAAYFAHTYKLPILPIGLLDTIRKDGKFQARIGKLIEPGENLEAKTWEIMHALSELTGYKLPAQTVLDRG